MLRLKAALRDLGAESYIEFSGRKGWHLWVFFRPHAPNTAARRAGRDLLKRAGLEGVEVFPKQDRVSRDRPGSLIKLPLGIHQATGRRCTFASDSGETLPEQLGLLCRMRTIAPAHLTGALGLRSSRPTRSRPTAPDGTPAGATPGMMKPCVETLIREGTAQGYRNRAGFLIATEMRRIGAGRATAAGVLSAWNTRNRLPLLAPELAAVLASAYRPGDRYEFGCHWTGLLAEIMPEFCVGRRCCLYLDVLFEMSGCRESRERSGE